MNHTADIKLIKLPASMKNSAQFKDPSASPHQLTPVRLTHLIQRMLGLFNHCAAHLHPSSFSIYNCCVWIHISENTQNFQ